MIARQIQMILILSLGMWVTGCSDPVANIPEAIVNEVAESAPDQPVAVMDSTPAQARERFDYELTDQTAIGFEGFKPTGSHVGGFGSFSGTVSLVDGVIEGGSLDIHIDTTSLYSDDTGLTTRLESADFFDVERFPESTFKSTAITKDDDEFTITGDLTLHGITKNISFPAVIEVGPKHLLAEAEFTVNRFDFGIEYPGMADDLIRDAVLIMLDVEARRVE